MDKKQCILFRKATTDRLRLSNGGGQFHSYFVTRDVVTGAMDTTICRNPAVIGDIGPSFGGVNDLCAEDLTVTAVVGGNLSITYHRDAASDGVVLWSGLLATGKRLRFRENLGFVVE